MMLRSTNLSRIMPTAALLAALGVPVLAVPAAADTEEAVMTEVLEAADATEEAMTEAADVAMDAEEAEDTEEEEMSAEEAEKKAIADEMERLQTESRLRQARLSAELAPLQEEKQRLEAELSLLRARQSAENARRQMEKDQADFEQQIALAEMQRAVSEMQAQMQVIQTQQSLVSTERNAELSELQAKNQVLSTQTTGLQAELMAMQTRANYNAIDHDEIQYPANPLDGETLHISDRRIPLNGPIGFGMAEYITNRIHYFNNLDSEAPIFIVIDASPGGSVVEGFRIVTAMQNSDAPVHVVVKSFAASMAAAICTLADASYTYPNALILHHQVSSFAYGNLTQMREGVDLTAEMFARLADPIAEKMGVTTDHLVEMMYENSSNGDWMEFGDGAVELRWADHVVTEIKESAIVTAPGSFGAGSGVYFSDQDDHQPFAGFTQQQLFECPVQYETRTDGNGKQYIALPRLVPGDVYYMANPDGRYRIAE